MAKQKFDWLLLIIIFFLGAFGIDKIYKGSVKFFVIKLLLSLIGIGIIWNIYDFITCIMGRYKVNPFK